MSGQRIMWEGLITLSQECQKDKSKRQEKQIFHTRRTHQSPPNFLILDEPTNDVDLDTLRALEDYLEEYKGVLVIVSHDRSFTDKVTNHCEYLLHYI